MYQISLENRISAITGRLIKVSIPPEYYIKTEDFSEIVDFIITECKKYDFITNKSEEGLAIYTATNILKVYQHKQIVTDLKSAVLHLDKLTQESYQCLSRIAE